jgi:hypothetical protein
MKQLVEFPVEGGGTVVVEVDEPESEGGIVRAGRPGEIIARSAQTFQDAIERVRPTAETISESLVARLHSMDNAPDEIAVVFGLKLNTEAGVFLASVGSEATFEVTLTWRRGE